MTSSRVERIGDATLYLGDCREILPGLGAVNIVTDPPYGMAYDTDSRRFSGFKQDGLPPRGRGRADRLIHGDDAEFDPTHLVGPGKAIIWGANHFAAKLPRGTTLIWLKRSPQHYGTFLSDAEIGWQAGNHGVYVFYAEDSNARRRMEFTGDIMGASTAHPTQKPIALMAWCLRRIGIGSACCDPYMGSGTTGVAAIRLGHTFTGIEIEERWFDIACHRIEAEARQARLAV
jgi:DNA modification methylase